MRKLAYALGATAAAMAAHGSALATDTTNYVYDPLGRLVRVTTTGGPNNGLDVNTAYDPAGNRCSHHVGGSTGAPASPPGPCQPSGSSPPGNQPPVAVDDSASIPKCGSVTTNVVANDTDPENNTPLALVSVSYAGLRGEATMASSTSVTFVSNGAGVPGSAAIAYTVRDSLGATSNGTFTVSISATGQCQ
jgi:YD repeat-containing protein